MKKRKLWPLLCVPLLLMGCTNQMANTKLQTMGSPKNALVTVPTISGGGNASTSSSTINYQTSGYPSFYGYEKHEHAVTMAVGTTDSAYTSYVYHDVGIKVY